MQEKVYNLKPVVQKYTVVEISNLSLVYTGFPL